MNRRRTTLILWKVLLAPALLALGTPSSADEPSKPRKITTVEGITEYQLANGLRVLLFPDPSKPTVTVNITYFVGSRHEGYGETGMAHLLEHMVFKGTPDHPLVWKSLQDHGAQFNGTTSYDRTNYFETLAASDENLEFALRLEADRMVNSHIAKKDLDSEFSVVRNEFEMGENNPLGILSERIWSTAYLWHNYGKSTIGSREDIERVPIDRLQAFYKKYYQPDNAMLVVAGKFDEAKTLKLINEIFGKIPRPSRALEKTYTVEPTQDGEREVILRRVGDVQAVGCAYHICAGPHDDAAALDVLAEILDTPQTGRLYKALVDSEMAVSVRASADSLYDPGLLEIMAEVRPDKSLDDVRKVMVDVLDSLANQETTDEEVERAKNAYAKAFAMLMNDSGRVGIRLTESAAQGDWRLLFHHRDQMAKVNPSDVKRVAAQYLRPTNRTIGMFIPTKDAIRTKVPETPDVVALMKDYSGKEAVAVGEEFEAEPAAIEARTHRSELSQGVKLALLPKKSRGEKVNVSMAFHYGSEADFKGKVEAASFIDDMLTRGTSKHTRRELADQLDKLKATVNIGQGGGFGGRRRMMGGAGSGTPGALTVNIETIRENLPAVIALVGEMLRDSTFPEKEFKKVKKQRLSSAEQSQSEPMSLAMIEMRRRLAPYSKDDVRYVPAVGEQIERLKAVELDDVKELYKQLLGAGHAEVAVIGDFDSSEITTLLADALKNWKSGKPFERIAMPYKENKPDNLVINTPDKANALFAMGFNLELRDDDPDYPALSMANFMLGQNANSRLLNRIRQKEGLSYGCGSSLAAGSLDKSGGFFAFGICNPQNAEKAMACAREEIDKVLADGFTEEELEDARKGYLEQLKVQLSNDAMLAGMLSRDLYLNRTMKFRMDELDKIRKLNADDINAAVRKYLAPEKLVAVRAGDFEKIQEEKGEAKGKAKKKPKSADADEES
jgi:zinc protease